MCPEDGHSCDPAAEYKLVTFRTGTQEDAGSEGPFSIQGYGTLATSCHNKADATCTVAVLAGSDTLRVVGEEGTSDAWIFKVTDTQTGYPLVAWGDVVDKRVGDTDYYYTLTDGEGTFDFKRKVTFVTAGGTGTGSVGPFTVEGYGQIEESCYKDAGSECTVDLPLLPSLHITAGTHDIWVFKVKDEHGDTFLRRVFDYEGFNEPAYCYIYQDCDYWPWYNRNFDTPNWWLGNDDRALKWVNIKWANA